MGLFMTALSIYVFSHVNLDRSGGTQKTSPFLVLDFVCSWLIFMARRMLSGVQSVCRSTQPSVMSQLVRLDKSQIFHLKYPPESQVRISNPLASQIYSSRSSLSPTIFTTNAKAQVSISCLKMLSYKAKPTNAISSKPIRTQFMGALYPFSASSILGSRSFSSSLGGKEVSASSGSSSIGNGDTTNAAVIEWIDKIKALSADTTNYLGEKVKQTTDELFPYAQQLLESHPYLEDVIIPVSGTMAATGFAWFIMPKILRRFHKYATQGAVAFFPETFVREEIPYEKSFWGALEDPVRYLVTFMAFSQIAIMVAPKALASQYIVEAWRGALILSLIWFLHRWKTNVFSRALTAKNIAMVDREKLLTLDKVSSVGLFLIGLMALAEACGVAVQSVLTVGGIGGVATAFAAKDILGNVLSGLSMQFSKPFSLGDTIKAGSVEGQVIEMGLTTTSLLNAEKFPVIVPNSLFSSQVIVNKSRAEWRAMVTKIPLQSDELDKVAQISNDIKSMLKSHPKVFLGKEVPYCFLSRVESSFVELSLGCNLKHMSKDELYSTQEDILLQSVKIIKQHGAKLGSTTYDPVTQ